MKKSIASILLTGALIFGISTLTIAQPGESDDSTNTAAMAEDSTATDSGATASEPVTEPEPVVTDTPVEENTADMSIEEESLHQQIKTKFIEGDVVFMTPVLLCLIFGLALAIERIITLSLATTNTRKLLNDVEDALDNGGVEEALEVCRNTRGPVAAIFAQGLLRAGEGVEMVEKSVVSYGSVQMSMLEKGLVWISLFISLAPMLGFMGTVIGMIGAFDKIEAAGDISAQIVAGGIKVALLTTVGGLIVAIILQVFYNYIVSKIDSLVTDMEDSSISLIDILVRKNVSK